MLITLCYLSHAAGEDLSWLDSLLAGARARNETAGITGVLLSYAGYYVQVLEGDSDAVEQCFARISRDTRHRDVQVLRRQPVAERRFGGWAMRDVRPQGRPDPAVRQFLDQLAADRSDAKAVDRLIDLLDALSQRAAGPATKQ